jgi:hypothetical protein
MDADLELIWRMASAQTGLAVTVDQRPEPMWLAASSAAVRVCRRE